MLEIDYSTLNIVIDASFQGDDIKVFCPPPLKEDVEKNVLILSKFAGIKEEYNINMSLLIVDWRTYLIEIAERLAVIRYKDLALESNEVQNYVKLLTQRIDAMLERILAGSYIIEDYASISLKDSKYGENDKFINLIKGYLVFFILTARYYTLMPGEKSELDQFYTSSNVTEYITSMKTRQ